MSLLLLLRAMLIMAVGSCGNASFIGIQRKSCDRIKSVTKQWNEYKEVRLTTFLMYIKLIDKSFMLLIDVKVECVHASMSSMSMSPNCCSHGIGRLAIYVTKQLKILTQ